MDPISRRVAARYAQTLEPTGVNPTRNSYEGGQAAVWIASNGTNSNGWTTIAMESGFDTTAMDHPSEEARKTYLKDHPKANPKNHRVKKVVDESKEPVDKAEIDRASKSVRDVGKLLDQMLDSHNSGKDKEYVSPTGEQLPAVVHAYKRHVEKLYDGVNAIPAGKEKDRAKKLVRQIDDNFESINKELGYRWEDKMKWLSPGVAEKALKKSKPLVEELDKLLSGQRSLLAARVAARFQIATRR